jgi:phosphoribosylformylglycinamidine (FGAM) synthase PurS component
MTDKLIDLAALGDKELNYVLYLKNSNKILDTENKIINKSLINLKSSVKEIDSRNYMEIKL